MEEFSAGSALSALADRQDGNITKEQLLLSGLSHSVPSAPLQLNRQTSVTPGLRYRNLGKSGLRVSNIGLGTWPTFSPSVTEEKAEQIIVLAVESGINLFDLSEAHSGNYVIDCMFLPVYFVPSISVPFGREMAFELFVSGALNLLLLSGIFWNNFLRLRFSKIML
ncbi:hypothetical protein HHI36_006008 [Cryptolaemus montrouzieri]|uniref:NADP-dependent oxidoreductase domain-containing protein n=1 Tax=Cryptolaemus montrouzieri TaxID=559131 RepID=A0ABD2NVX5_9CUCU